MHVANFMNTIRKSLQKLYGIFSDLAILHRTQENLSRIYLTTCAHVLAQDGANNQTKHGAHGDIRLKQETLKELASQQHSSGAAQTHVQYKTESIILKI